MEESQIHQIYDKGYAQNYDQKFLLNDRSRINTEFERDTIAQLLSEIGNNPTWLDVACGTGYFLSCFPEIERTGLDISPAMLAVARQANPNIPLLEGDYRDQRPQWQGQWDLVSSMWWAYGYVESLAELEQLVANFADWTSDRGVCFLPVCEPELIGVGKLKLPYTYTNDDELGGYGGSIQFEAVIWTWIDEQTGKRHENMIAPQLAHLMSLFEKYFQHVEVVDYSASTASESKAIVARHRKPEITSKPAHLQPTANPSPTVEPSKNTSMVIEQEGAKDTPRRAKFNLLKLSRSQEWWLYKIAPLLGIACAQTLILQLPPGLATVSTLIAFLSIASVAAYGYLLNDIYDIEGDRQANKPNAAAKLQPWQRVVFSLLFVCTGFAAPLLAHFGSIPLLLLGTNYLLPTLYSAPPLRLKERGVLGILSDAAAAHLVPTLFVAATFLRLVPNPPAGAIIFTGFAAAHTFFVGLRGIFLHQLWDRDNDLRSGTVTFATQRQPETVRHLIANFVFPGEILLLGSVIFLLCHFAPSLAIFCLVYLLLTLAKLKTSSQPFTPSPPSPPQDQCLIPYDLYEVWLPLALTIVLSLGNPYYLGFTVLMLMLFFPSVKNRVCEMINIVRAFFTTIKVGQSEL